ncbi:uncharacterized protein LOC131635257 [Vicia villosa]|uniref:uncharacterized protein LOC131635257 n=1 Tax=Vicia villosa TaxID=3911 RepID=UPI00273A98C3|nr:uncharacterized protein LOC131635257 [Vicia villosa]XP_058761851.1 uncharacterized protein LOC131635257 [Vicia villosa]XP_058761852.1 uncharacterized protein LOC131635257 [Vicia villosa]XP_058761853.1 uncharacterized protein LOC131635257 [Vicia villosa]XP_058761854.1 uncharacterized protein LOC131635257 [Vicia villosa]XP_058761855.1 uncharacterized protein LOC131635257 [Vicia villosa]XP_058761857.1 uncharacterized protein LOC131635257 [Vicia villosa]XP_058761858.1 uncharacterized protein 
MNNMKKGHKHTTTSPLDKIVFDKLALLLHQELNSSPRVPRARQTGSLPQLTSTSATNMLMKRASVGGKVCKRKYKDATRDGVCSSREPKDETKRIEKEKEKVQSSSDQRNQDMAYVENASVKEEGSRACVTAANSITSNVVSRTPALENSSPPSPREDCNLSSKRNSPRNISDDDTPTAGRPDHHTLPGLINDIMSKGRRMTYEELCGAVLPVWFFISVVLGVPTIVFWVLLTSALRAMVKHSKKRKYFIEPENLRKHNGER